MTSLPHRYPELEVSGTSFEMGCQIGEGLREQLRGFDAIAIERVNKSVSISREKALAVAADSLPFVEEYSPAMLEELRGMSRGSGLDLEAIMMLQIRNQLTAELDAACTAFSIAPQRTTARTLIGQNWDNDPALDPFTVVLTRRPDGEPAHMTITQAGLIAYMGVSDAGVGVCLNTLPAPSRALGVPHYFTVRGIFQARSLSAAVEAVRRANRAIPANIILATPQGPADLEVTIDDVHVLRDDGNGVVTHTNHCVHPALLAVNDDFPELAQSGSRKIRVDELLDDVDAQFSVEAMKLVLQDHDNYPGSICRHANDHPTTGFWCSVFSIIIEVEAGIMHVSRGNPCERPFESYSLN